MSIKQDEAEHLSISLFLIFQSVIEGEVELKEWMCVQVGDHKRVGETIEKFQKNGWRLHTYACAGIGAMMAINHYLLFEKGE